MTRAKFNASFEGIGEMLNSEFMEAAMLARAEKVAATAKADAESYADTTEFADSISASAGRHGGAKHDRAFGRVSSDDPAGLSIETGHIAHKSFRNVKATGVPSEFVEGKHSLVKALMAE